MTQNKFPVSISSAVVASIALGVLAVTAGCGSKPTSQGSADRSANETSTTATAGDASKRRRAEAKNGETRSVEPQVQSEIGRAEAEKRASLLKEAQSALDETRNALAALDRGDTRTALSALARASGQLDLVVTRDPQLALAPVSVETVIYDLYATPDAVKTAVRQARGDLSDDRVQQARHELEYLASEADVNVMELPLASYPAAIKAVAPLIDQGNIDQAKTALAAALDSIVIDTLVIPLPQVRAEAMVAEAQQLSSQGNKAQTDRQRVQNLIGAARNEVQLAEALGYGSKADYKPLYAQMDELQKAAEGGNTGGLFDRMRQSLKRFRFTT